MQNYINNTIGTQIYYHKARKTIHKLDKTSLAQNILFKKPFLPFLGLCQEIKSVRKHSNN